MISLRQPCGLKCHLGIKAPDVKVGCSKICCHLSHVSYLDRSFVTRRKGKGFSAEEKLHIFLFACFNYKIFFVHKYSVNERCNPQCFPHQKYISFCPYSLSMSGNITKTLISSTCRSYRAKFPAGSRVILSSGGSGQGIRLTHSPACPLCPQPNWMARLPLKLPG